MVSQENPTLQEYIAVNDNFRESGVPELLLMKYRLTPENIVSSVHEVASLTSPSILLSARTVSHSKNSKKTCYKIKSPRVFKELYYFALHSISKN